MEFEELKFEELNKYTKEQLILAYSILGAVNASYRLNVEILQKLVKKQEEIIDKLKNK